MTVDYFSETKVLTRIDVKNYVIMNTKRNKTEEILESLDGVSRAQAPDFFYTRLKARLEKETGTGSYSPKRSWVLRPIFVIASLCLVLLLNAFIFLQSNTITTTSANTDDESIQSIAAEYSLNDTISEEVYQ